MDPAGDGLSPTSEQPAPPALTAGPSATIAADLSDQSPPPNDRPSIPGYRIDAVIASGGMGTVYRATHETLQREVALKVMRPELARDPQYVERFLREARAAAKVSHPGVVAVHDAGFAAGQLYLAMELVPGGDLARRLAGGRSLGEPVALALAAAMIDALGAIHRAGLVHRDLKPENILIAADGSPKIADLGLARMSAGDDRMTQTGHALGTPAYMSPEQANGLADLDARSDIYSFGATLFALLAGRPPFVGATSWATVKAVLVDPAPDVRSCVPAVSASTAAIIARCLLKDREQRYQSAQELAADIERARSGGAVSQVRAIAATIAPSARRAGSSLGRVAVAAGRWWWGLSGQWRWISTAAALAAMLVLMGVFAERSRDGRLRVVADDGNPSVMSDVDDAFKQLRSTVRRTSVALVDGSVERIDQRVLSVIADHGMTVRKHRVDPSSAVTEAEDAGGGSVRVLLSRVGIGTVEVAVRVGAFGDRERSQALVREITR